MGVQHDPLETKIWWLSPRSGKRKRLWHHHHFPENLRDFQLEALGVAAQKNALTEPYDCVASDFFNQVHYQNTKVWVYPSKQNLQKLHYSFSQWFYYCPEGGFVSFFTPHQEEFHYYIIHIECTFMAHVSHPLHKTLDKLKSSFSSRLIQPHCPKERYRKSFYLDL